MELKGLDNFLRKLPAFAGGWIIALPLYLIAVFSASLSALIAFDSLPSNPGLSPLGPAALSLSPLIGELVIGSIGFFLVYQMWRWRKALKARYGPLSYQRIFFVGFTGILCVISIPAGIFIRFWAFAPSFWAGSPLSSPIESFAGPFGAEALWARLALSALFIIAGLATMVRSLLTFGFDYMAVVYLYFPEESEMQESRIFSVLRHPTYSGAIYVAIGGALFTGAPLSFAMAALFACMFYAHVHFVEEKELIERFGKSYEDYRRKVPAFIIRHQDAGAFLDYLLGRG
jgi:protein-S-isoprenylcysteine O-methyltransferase Ste14